MYCRGGNVVKGVRKTGIRKIVMALEREWLSFSKFVLLIGTTNRSASNRTNHFPYRAITVSKIPVPVFLHSLYYWVGGPTKILGGGKRISVRTLFYGNVFI